MAAPARPYFSSLITMKARTKSGQIIDISNTDEVDEIINSLDDKSLLAIIADNHLSNYGNLRKVSFIFPWEKEVTEIIKEDQQHANT